MQNIANITSPWTDENIIDLVRKVRNDLIKDFLDERFLKDYIANKYGMKELTAVKIEFIKRDLKEFLIAPVNTDHYKTIVDLIRETNSASLSEGNDELFYSEVDQILKKYIYQ
ncbi:hypothetical protein ACFQ21_07475 [Ohtaekwangia kribbensis]|jgi:hypothetical protein|uniref:Uncharacterized protein n=1 Tax=Ohtaekwangia kribbensis TaxID=688913 RepID=A0ABW3K017_9BACT